MRTTADNEAMSLALTLDLARKMSEQLEDMMHSSGSTELFPIRLAYAHALGLLDQLGTLVENRAP